MKYYTVHFEGIDKTGKDTISKYFDQICGHIYVNDTRGLITNITYNRIFNRDVSYDIENDKNQVYVYLTCNEEDRNIRCKLTGEPPLGKDKDELLAEYQKTIDEMRKAGFIIYEYDTSKMTAYSISKDLLQKMKDLNK